MLVEYTGRQTTITKKLKAQAEAGLEQIAKLVGRSPSAHVILTVDKYRQIAEVTVKTRGQSLVATCEATEMATALHDALAKVEQQAVRHNQKSNTLARHPKKGARRAGESEEAALAVTAAESRMAVPGKAARKAAKKSGGGNKGVAEVQSFSALRNGSEPHVVRSADSVAERPMSLEEAVKDFESLDREVFVFRDLEGLAMVLHCRRDGRLELIEVPAA